MKKRVLVVDDDVDFSETLGESFFMKGCDVDIAGSGEEAIALCRDSCYDLVFLDVKLPGKNGVDSLHEIRKIDPNARVVIMTGYSLESQLTRARKEGAEAVFHKTLDMNLILGYIEKVKPRVAVLLVDDDLDFSESTREILVDAGYDVAVAQDARLALEHMENQEVDVLLLDVCLRDSTSLNLYQYIHHCRAEIPTIVVTGFPAEEAQTISMLKWLCVKEVLTKPVEPGHLLSVLGRYANRDGFNC